MSSIALKSIIIRKRKENKKIRREKVYQNLYINKNDIDVNYTYS